MSSLGTASGLATGISVAHEMRLVFRGVDRVSNVAESITSKIRAMSGAIVVLGATSGVVTNLAASFGILTEAQAKTLDKTAAIAIAIGGVVNAMAALATSERVATAAMWLMNEAQAVKLAFTGPLGWAILASAAAIIAGIAITTLFGEGHLTSKRIRVKVPSPAEAREALLWHPFKPMSGPRFVRSGNTLEEVQDFPIPGLPGFTIEETAQVMQHGGDWMTSGPTLFLAGEAGRERVIVLPEGHVSGSAGTSIDIDISGSGGPDATARAVRDQLELLMARHR